MRQRKQRFDIASKSLIILEKSPDLWYNCDITKTTIKTKKEIFHMVSISHDFYDEQCRSNTILQFAKEVNLAKILEQANVRKARGVGVLTVFIQLLTVAFYRSFL